MTKRQFVQHTAPLMLLAQILRQDREDQKADPARAIAWAETLWERLTQAGYGPETATGARDIKDHVASLSPALAAGFSRLWRAYALPKGKQDAAQRWAQIAPDAALAEIIIAAADADSREARPEGALRKYLQGWLSERRWEDCQGNGKASPGQASHGAANADAIDTRRAEVAELVAERSRLTKVLRLSQDDIQAKADLERIDAALAGYGVHAGSGHKRPPSAAGLKAVSMLLKPKQEDQ